MKVYITFGQIHVHSVNGRTFDKDTVAVINCESYIKGRESAFEWFNGKFHHCETRPPDMSFFPKGLLVVNP